jgi:hypothetical protein
VLPARVEPSPLHAERPDLPAEAGPFARASCQGITGLTGGMTVGMCSSDRFSRSRIAFM